MEQKENVNQQQYQQEVQKVQRVKKPRKLRINQLVSIHNHEERLNQNTNQE